MRRTLHALLLPVPLLVLGACANGGGDEKLPDEARAPVARGGGNEEWFVLGPSAGPLRKGLEGCEMSVDLGLAWSLEYEREVLRTPQLIKTHTVALQLFDSGRDELKQLLAAARAEGAATAEDIGGRPATVVALEGSPSVHIPLSETRTLVLSSSDLDAAELVRLAREMRAVTKTEWRALVAAELDPDGRADPPCP